MFDRDTEVERVDEFVDESMVAVDAGNQGKKTPRTAAEELKFQQAEKERIIKRYQDYVQGEAQAAKELEKEGISLTVEEKEQANAEYRERKAQYEKDLRQVNGELFPLEVAEHKERLNKNESLNGLEGEAKLKKQADLYAEAATKADALYIEGKKQAKNVVEAEKLKREADVAAVAFYDSLDDLRDFYREQSNILQRSEKREMQIKYHDMNAQILKYRAAELKRDGRLDDALQAESRAEMERMAAGKFIQEIRREKLVAEAPEVAKTYKKTKLQEHGKFLENLKVKSNENKEQQALTPEQKQAMFVANFMEKSAEMYLINKRSYLDSDKKEAIKEQFKVLLHTGGDNDLEKCAEAMTQGLDGYIERMNQNLDKGNFTGRAVGIAGPTVAEEVEQSPYKKAAEDLNSAAIFPKPRSIYGAIESVASSLGWEGTAKWAKERRTNLEKENLKAKVEKMMKKISISSVGYSVTPNKKREKSKEIV